jgi:parallel beta-helix repeat protein
VIERLDIGSPIVDLVTRKGRASTSVGPELQLLAGDGELHRAVRAQSDSRVAEWVIDAVGQLAVEGRGSLIPVHVTGMTGGDLLLVGNTASLTAVNSDRPEQSVSVELPSSPVAVLPLRLGADALDDLIVLVEESAAPLMIPLAPTAVITVNSALDVAVAGDGSCTLREAINNSNVNGDTTAGDCAAGTGFDTIAFAIGAGAVTIPPAAGLPTIGDPVLIDGTTQPGFAGSPIVELDGTAAGAAFGLAVTAGSSTIRGLVINRFASDGIRLQGGGGNRVEGSFIGTDLTGGVALGNGNGVVLVDTADNVIGGAAPGLANTISGNVGAGVLLANPTTTGNLVLGNRIGTDPSATFAVPNAGSGVILQATVPNNGIGGAAAGQGNVISGNGQLGVGLLSAAQGNLIEGNRIGTDAAAGAAIPNGLSGVYLQQAASNTVGRAAAGAGNLISANGQSGVAITTASFSNTVQGNLIGTDGGGGIALGNQRAGVDIETDSFDNLVGGAAAGERNLISGNVTNGVEITGLGSTGNRVQGNLIGTDLLGGLPLGNQDSGIVVSDTSIITIGGDAPGAGNVISANGLGTNMSGLALDNATDVTVQGNRIGTDFAGGAALGNGRHGVVLLGSSSNLIGGTAPGARNLVSANGEGGIGLLAGSDGKTVQGNHVGTDAAGALALGNGLTGSLAQGAEDNLSGGAAPGAGNLASGNGESGIGIQFVNATGNIVQGNRVGTDAAGLLAIPNATVGGIAIEDGASGNLVGGPTAAERNLSSGNDGPGVIVQLSASGNTIQGNWTGTDAGGALPLANQIGVALDDTSSNIVLGNLVSGNQLSGFQIQNGASNNEILGNLVGTDTAGTAPLGNGGSGVVIFEAPDNLVGGSTPPDRNVISANGEAGVALGGASSSGNRVLGNFIGVDTGGGTSLGNVSFGVFASGAPGNLIGSSAAGEGNVVSGNLSGGVALIDAADGNSVQGNAIGSDASGANPLANGGTGVLVQNAFDNLIGGTTAGSENRIAFNSGVGVGMVGAGGVGNTFQGNSVAANAGLGIALDTGTVLPNDPGDVDTGPNDLQNYPRPVCADISSGSVVLEGRLASSPGANFRVEVFVNGACDASGHGEGDVFLGFFNLATGPLGLAPFNVTLGSLPLGAQVTTTATSPGNSTSEFSTCVPVVDCSITPLVFGPTLLAVDKSMMGWGVTEDVRFVRGDLAGVSTYSIFDTGDRFETSTLDTSADNPGSGDGVWYLVRSICCGVWSTALGAEPDREATLP